MTRTNAIGGKLDFMPRLLSGMSTPIVDLSRHWFFVLMVDSPQNDLLEPDSPDPRELLVRIRNSARTPLIARALAEQFLAQPRENILDEDFSEVHQLLGHALRLEGQYDQAKLSLTLSRKLASKIGASLVRANSVMQLGLIAIEERTFDLAITYFKEACAYFNVSREIEREAQSNFYLANTYIFMGEQHLAMSHLDSALIKFNLVNSKQGVTAVYSALAQFAAEGKADLASRQKLEATLRLLPSDASESNRIILQLALADCEYRLGMHEHSKAVLTSATTRAGKLGLHLLQCKGLLLQAAHAQKLGEEERAAGLSKTAAALALETGCTEAAEAFRSTLNC